MIAVVAVVAVAFVATAAAPSRAPAEWVREEPDSAGPDERWLPISEEDLESTEALEEERPRVPSGALLRGTIARGRFEIRRIAVFGGGRGLGGELGFLLEERRYAPGARITLGNELVTLAGGRVSVSRAPPLFAAALRITRSGRRVSVPRSGAIAAAPSLGASAGAIDGGAIVLRGAASVWAFAGVRSESREPIGGGGLGIARGGTRVSAAIGAAGRPRVAEGGAATGGLERSVSVTVARRGRGRSMALEALGGNIGRAFLGEASTRGGAVLVSARWRFYSWAARNVAAEVNVETLGSDARARLTWRSWSANATADDGLLELEGTSRRGAIPLRARLGAIGIGRIRDATRVRDLYGLLDATLARDGGRSLAFHVMRRGSEVSGLRASSTTVGTRLDVRAGPFGEHSILVESTRLTTGAPAWGVELTPSGETTLRARSRPGMWVKARGGFEARHWRFGYALQRAEDAGGQGPWGGAVWIRLDR